MVLYKPSDVPKDWGLAVYMGRSKPLKCSGCNKELILRDQYLYQYTPDGPLIVHNYMGCFNELFKV